MLGSLPRFIYFEVAIIIKSFFLLICLNILRVPSSQPTERPTNRGFVSIIKNEKLGKKFKNIWEKETNAQIIKLIYYIHFNMNIINRSLCSFFLFVISPLSWKQIIKYFLTSGCVRWWFLFRPEKRKMAFAFSRNFRTNIFFVIKSFCFEGVEQSAPLFFHVECVCLLC